MLLSVVVKAQKLFNSHGSFLTYAIYHHITHYDETNKRAHDSQIARAKEYLKLSHGRPSQTQSSGTNPVVQLNNSYKP